MPPSLWSEVLSKVPSSHDFSEKNLPYGVCSRDDDHDRFLATRLGDFVIRLDDEALGLSPAVRRGEREWNRLMRLGKQERVGFRESLKRALLGSSSPLHNDLVFERCVMPISECCTHLPCRIGDYTDFYASRDHAVNVGTMFRGRDNALQPNWVHLPVGYHGRSSSVVTSPCVVHYPNGQLDQGRKYGPSQRLDFELEVGFFLGGPENPLGSSLSVAEARERLFGLVLLNDWSARDVQTWEYVPLGPFCAKNFCTSISPWIIPVEALKGYKAEPLFAPRQDPQPLPYLRDDEYLLFDIDLFVSIQPSGKAEETIVSKSNLRYLYWTPAQMVAHHSSTGCSMCAGDLIGSGTISGPAPDSFGSMLELSWNGTKPVTLTTGEQRTFLQVGDVVTLTGRIKGGGIGFGECTGVIRPPYQKAEL